MLTGGKNGANYTHLELHEALPNPVFEKAIRSLTNLNGKQYDDVVAGLLHVKPDGTLTAKSEKDTLTGGKAIGQMLRKLDPAQEIANFQGKLKKAKSAVDISELNKKIRYLTALKDLGLKPEEAYMRKMVPVVPPMYRPVYEMPNRGLQVSRSISFTKT